MRRALRFLFILLPLAGCAPTPEDQIREAMRAYDRMVLAMDSNAIANLYVPGGEARHDGALIAQGPDAIRTFLATFDGKVKVESTQSTIESITTDHSTAIASGAFHQRVHTLPDQKVIEVSGRFEAQWVLLDDHRWHLKTMSTFSPPPNK